MPYSPSNPRYCEGCHKPRKACVCSWLQPVDALPTHLRVHPHEVARARSTSWLAHRLLKNSTYTLEGEDEEPDYGGCALLFPGPSSRPWQEVPFTGVVLVDGTWDECAAMLRASPALQALPRISLGQAYTGGYQVRRPPFGGALCTAEALGRLFEEMGLSAGARLLDLVIKLNSREAELSQGAAFSWPKREQK